MKGNITRRGKNSSRLKFDLGRDPATGGRLTRYITFRGTKKQAEAELIRQLAALDAGTFVEASKVTVAQFMRTWITVAEATALSPKTAERYRQLIEQQIVPHLGTHAGQKLRAAHIAAWHATLLKRGSSEGEPLSARTVGHAHRVLHKALSDATKLETLSRNPAALVVPPKVEHGEVQILAADQVGTVLAVLRDTPLFAPVVVLLATGMRRGELMGLRWGDLDLDGGKVRIERAIEKTMAHGLRVKPPKTKSGRRTIALPVGAVTVLRRHLKAQLEHRISLGLGRLPDDAYVFGTAEGGPADPDKITKDWKRALAAMKLPAVTLHTLRHSHASALIASGTDPVTVSRRLGHASPTVTMSVYAHLFDRGDEVAAQAIDTVLNIDEK